MNTSNEIDQLVTALALAQLTIPTVEKRGKNPHFGSKYVKLDDMLEAIKKPLAENNMVFIQAAAFVDGRVLVTSRLFHKSGQWIETYLSIKPQADTAQAIGSAISYGKRYQCAAMFTIAESDDDDGEAATALPIPKQSGYKKNPQAPKPEAFFNFKDDNLKQRLWEKLEEMEISFEFHQQIVKELEGKPYSAFNKIVAPYMPADHDEPI